ncbi:hypothetical protein Bbelb_155240 [Branchiostoma belcheri]|nr:hypothetical protein Bbelb_155240 [Branchiostoma belcheri]
MAAVKTVKQQHEKASSSNAKLRPQSTEWDTALVCPELCPVRHGSGQSPRFPDCRPSPGTVPRHGLGQGTVWDTTLGTEWDTALVCSELCPVRHGSGQSPRFPDCRLAPGTVWDTRRVSQTVPRHCLGQGTDWDTTIP